MANFLNPNEKKILQAIRKTWKFRFDYEVENGQIVSIDINDMKIDAWPY